jgi:signal transduction histidine kinase
VPGRAGGPTTPTTAQAGQVLLEEIERLDELSRSFAQFGRPPEGPPSPVDLGELLDHLVRRIDLAGGEVVLRRPDEPLFVEGHPVALERVVRNLVVNALDATAPMRTARVGEEDADPPLPVEVELGRDPDSGDRVRIRVLDRGAGIPEAEVERIWDPEFTTKRKGTGLGLPLVRQVVDAHGGAVTARNRPDGGAVFELSLPRIPDPGPAPGPGPSHGEAS